MSLGWSSRRGRFLSRTGSGVLGWVIGPDLVDEAVGDGLAWEMRLRALPSRLGVYFVLGLCLFSSLPYGQVLRELTSGLEGALAGGGTPVAAEASPANIAAFGKPGARKRRPARTGTGGDDGTAAAAAAAAGDTPGRPQLPLDTLVACGTRALLDAAAGPLRGKGTGEQGLARQLLGSLHRGMLLLAERGVYSYGLWTAAAATGADLLWRARKGRHQAR